ncbi:MAG: Stk1 family PASTA domain-containing Ser/Thr kinase [Patulibacter sp.]|nr:Stk1 family PASTA domain-containing Ser/Thr kinase [Patulibacter sp.]
MNRAGQTIDGRYLVERRLGTGGMADVFACEDLQLGRHVALKVLHENLAQDPDVVARFRRESQSAAGLQHPHIVQVFDRGDWDGIPYMAMELVDGVTLKDVTRDQAPLDPIRSIDQISQVLDALRYAHRRGLVHRDIKPQNVLVGPDGELKVADFGIARAVDDLQMTQTGMIVGTAHYIAPEQAAGQPVTPAADLYAVGVVLFEMLTGRLPFEGDQPVAIALQHVNDDPPAVSIVNPNVPRDLEDVVMRALAKSPEERFADAEEFIGALQTVRQRILSGAPVPEPGVAAAAVPTYGPGQPQSTGGWMQPAAGMAVPAGITGYDAEEQAKARRRRNWTFAAVGTLVLAMVIALLAYLAFGRMETVPNVKGSSAETATQRLEDRGFKVIVDPRPSNEPANTVLRSDPAAGRKLRRGSSVRIVTSQGPSAVAIPAVSGLTESAAKQALRDAGFTNITDTTESSSGIAAGNAIATDPAAGTKVEPSTRIHLRLSTGPSESDDAVSVPNLIGQSRADASAALRALGLGVRVSERNSRRESPGTVLDQDPLARSEVETGSTVTLVLARRPRTSTSTTTTTTTTTTAPPTTTSNDVTVPNVEGKSRAAAVRELERAGLEAKVTRTNVSDRDQDGVVVGQRPNGGRVSRGAEVSVQVGRYVAPTPSESSDAGAGTNTTASDTTATAKNAAATVKREDGAPQ